MNKHEETIMDKFNTLDYLCITTNAWAANYRNRLPIIPCF